MHFQRFCFFFLLLSNVYGDEEQKVFKVSTGVTWDSSRDDEMLDQDRLNFKPRTQITSLVELALFLDDQALKDEMSVVVSFFEMSQIENREESYLRYLSAGGIPQNSMVSFALCTDLDVPRSLKVPPPLPRSVSFSPAPGENFLFEMRQAKFFEDGQIFLDGVLPVLAFLETGDHPKVRFPSSVREAMLGSGKGSITEDGEL